MTPSSPKIDTSPTPNLAFPSSLPFQPQYQPRVGRVFPAKSELSPHLPKPSSQLPSSDPPFSPRLQICAPHSTRILPASVLECRPCSLPPVSNTRARVVLQKLTTDMTRPVYTYLESATWSRRGHFPCLVDASSLQTGTRKEAFSTSRRCWNQCLFRADPCDCSYLPVRCEGRCNGIFEQAFPSIVSGFFNCATSKVGRSSQRIGGGGSY